MELSTLQASAATPDSIVSHRSWFILITFPQSGIYFIFHILIGIDVMNLLRVSVVVYY